MDGDGEGGRPGNADARRKIVVRRRQRIGNAGIAGTPALRLRGTSAIASPFASVCLLLTISAHGTKSWCQRTPIQRQPHRPSQTVLRECRHIEVAVVKVTRWPCV